MTDSLHRSVDRSVDRLATPVGPPVGQEVLRTDGRTDGLTKSLTHQPDITSSFVTRAPAYGFSSDDSQDTPTPRPGWFTCRLCSPPMHERGGQVAFYAHWNRLHGTGVKR